MADIAKIIAQVILEQGGAAAGWSKFQADGQKAFAGIESAATRMASAVNSSMARAQAGLTAMGARAEAVGKKMEGIGRSISVGIGLPLGLVAKKAVDAFHSQEEALALLDAALESTGNKVGITRDELIKFAEDTQKWSTFSDDAIEGMQATLLKFQSVHGDVFRQAEKVIIDYAARTHQDLSGAAQQIGRALDDPVRGMTLLRRAGVVLSTQQQDLVKNFVATGQAAKAQGVLLDALAAKIGPAAKKLAETDLGKFTNAMNNLDDALEKVGARIAPVLTQIAQGITFLVASFDTLPEPIQAAVVYFGMFLIALGPALYIVGSVTTAFGLLSKGLAYIIPLLGQLAIPISIVVILLSAMAAAQGGWLHLLANTVIGLGAVIFTVGELYDKLRTLYAWITNAGPIVPSDWGTNILKAGIQLKMMADEADKGGDKIEGFGQKAADAASNANIDIGQLTSALGESADQIGDIESDAGDAANAAGKLGAVSMAKTNSGLEQMAKDANVAEVRLNGVLKILKQVASQAASTNSAVANSHGAKASGGADDDIRFGGKSYYLIGTDGHAGGGYISGRGTSKSDSIISRLSRGEFVVRAAAVAKYGVGLMKALNAGMLPRFAVGGLVGSFAPRPSSQAAGGAGMADRAFTLMIGDQAFTGLRAPSDTAEEMMSFARSRQVRSAGKKPTWFR